MNQFWEIAQTDTGEAITLNTAKEWLRVTSSDDDTIITDLITLARKRIETYTTRSLVTKDIVLTGSFDSMFPLPYAPIDAISQVRKLTGQDIAGANEWDVLSAADYQTIGTTELHFAPRYSGVYEITYSTLADTDTRLLTDLKRVLLWMYENRGDDTDSVPQELFSNAKQLKNLTWV